MKEGRVGDQTSMDGWIDGWLDGWTDGWIGKYVTCTTEGHIVSDSSEMQRKPPTCGE